MSWRTLLIIYEHPITVTGVDLNFKWFFGGGEWSHPEITKFYRIFSLFFNIFVWMKLCFAFLGFWGRRPRVFFCFRDFQFSDAGKGGLPRIFPDFSMSENKNWWRGQGGGQKKSFFLTSFFTAPSRVNPKGKLWWGNVILLISSRINCEFRINALIYIFIFLLRWVESPWSNSTIMLVLFIRVQNFLILLCVFLGSHISQAVTLYICH